jgi:hypothetical protein
MLRHKWFVLLAGIRIGAPLWRLLIHDWSKFRPSEWSAYRRMYYTEKGDTQAYVRAWNYHQNRNKHHWQYWVMLRDDGAVEKIQMPPKYVREMVADWAGAGRAIKGEWEFAQWYSGRREMILLHPETRALVDGLVAALDITINGAS